MKSLDDAVEFSKKSGEAFREAREDVLSVLTLAAQKAEDPFLTGFKSPVRRVEADVEVRLCASRSSIMRRHRATSWPVHDACGLKSFSIFASLPASSSAFAKNSDDRRVAGGIGYSFFSAGAAAGAGRGRGGNHRRRCGRESRQRDGGVMPMAVLDGPHFSRRNLAGRLRRGRELLLGRHAVIAFAVS